MRAARLRLAPAVLPGIPVQMVVAAAPWSSDASSCSPSPGPPNVSVACPTASGRPSPAHMADARPGPVWDGRSGGRGMRFNSALTLRRASNRFLQFARFLRTCGARERVGDPGPRSPAIAGLSDGRVAAAWCPLVAGAVGPLAAVTVGEGAATGMTTTPVTAPFTPSSASLPSCAAPSALPRSSRPPRPFPRPSVARAPSSDSEVGEHVRRGAEGHLHERPELARESGRAGDWAASAAIFALATALAASTSERRLTRACSLLVIWSPVNEPPRT